jgi:hypothetical protein
MGNKALILLLALVLGGGCSYKINPLDPPYPVQPVQLTFSIQGTGVIEAKVMLNGGLVNAGGQETLPCTFQGIFYVGNNVSLTTPLAGVTSCQISSSQGVLASSETGGTLTVKVP